MAGGSRLIAIDEVDLSTLDMWEKPLITLDNTVQYEWASRRRESVSGSAFLGTAAQTAIWNILFQPGSDEAHDALMAMLTSTLGERRLLAIRDDAQETKVYTMGALLRIVPANYWAFDAQFEAENSLWRSVEPTRTVKTFTRGTDQMMRVSVPGNTPMRPRIFISPVEQRATPTVYAGWKYMRQVQITWNGQVPLVREALRISLGNITSALVAASKMQADGDDLRVILNGVEQPRTVQGINTASDYVWFIVPKIDPGETIAVDLIYGNSVANNPPTLTYPDKIAYDSTISTNAVLEWNVDRNDAADYGKGLWHLFSTSAVTGSDYGIPGAWRLSLTNIAPGDPNIHYVAPNTASIADVTKSLASLFATVGSQGVNVDLFNDYDGIEFYSPMPISQVRLDYILASTTGGGKFVILARQSVADTWSIVHSDDDSSASVAAANYTIPTPARHIAVAMWAKDGGSWDVDTFGEGSHVGLIDSVMRVTRDDSDLSINVGTEREVYELAAELRVGGGNEDLPPYRSILIGNARQLTGKGTPRMILPFDSGTGNGQSLMIDGETGECRIWTATAGEPDRMVLYAPEHAIKSISAWGIRETFSVLPDVVESPSSEWLIVSPDRKAIPNGGFNTGIHGWAIDDTVPVNDYIASHATLGGATVALSWDNADGVDDPGCIQIDVTPSTAPGDSGAFVLNQQVFPVYGQETIDISANVKTSSANLIPVMGVILYEDSEGNTAIQSTSSLPYTPTVNEWDGRPGSFAMRSLARSYRIYVGYVASGANRTGIVNFDDVRFIDRDIMVQDESIGKIRVTVELEGTYL